MDEFKKFRKLANDFNVETDLGMRMQINLHPASAWNPLEYMAELGTARFRYILVHQTDMELAKIYALAPFLLRVRIHLHLREIDRQKLYQNLKISEIREFQKDDDKREQFLSFLEFELMVS